MEKTKKIRLIALIASALALIFECVYPTVFIKWIIPLYAACILLAAVVAYLLFFAEWETPKGPLSSLHYRP